jgi:bacterioferritin-associated ferredoxin
VIICHCEVVTDREVDDAIDAGARTIAQICALTRAGRGCGSCVFTVKRLLCQHEATIAEPIVEVERAAS